MKYKFKTQYSNLTVHTKYGDCHFSAAGDYETIDENRAKSLRACKVCREVTTAQVAPAPKAAPTPAPVISAPPPEAAKRRGPRPKDPAKA